MSQDTEFTPECLSHFAERIAKLRLDLLCMDHAGAEPMAEEYTLSALAHLDLSVRELRKAIFIQRAALAGR